MGIIEFSAPTIAGIAAVVKWIVSICGAVWLGVIVFTLLLKLITLPFDYASRASMRKNSVKMEQMRPELEKLQKQYADNKDLYNQKMMALYKKNGYSMFGACLPTILTLVMFIVAINGFTDYSKFQNQEYFYHMTNSYNNVVYAGFELNEDTSNFIYRDYEKGEFSVNIDNVRNADQDKDGKVICSEGENQVIINYEDKDGVFSLWTENGYSKYVKNVSQNKPSFALIEDKLENSTLACEQNNYLKVMVDGVQKSFNEVNGQVKSQVEVDGVMQEEKWDVNNFIVDIRQEMSAKTYRDEEQGFIWVKNIWATDSTMAHPIESDWNKFKTTHGYNGLDLGNDGYSNLIAKLDAEKTEPNGYFILIALTALSSLAMQLIMNKSQKAQMELQTVDGQGAQTQKMMQWMMPIMMAFFAFMYTAAFSLYIIVNSILSMLTTICINFIVDRQMKKELKKTNTDVVRSKVHQPKPEEKAQPEKKQKKNKDDRFAHENGGDFLSGKADKKHYRGRTK